MKKIKVIIEIMFLFNIIFIMSIKAQPYLYHSVQYTDTIDGDEYMLEKIQRYDIHNNTDSDFPPVQYVGENVIAVSDPSQSYLAIGVINIGNTIYNCADTSLYFELGAEFVGVNIDEILYSSERNKLYLFYNDYSSISILNILNGQIDPTLVLPTQYEYNVLMYPQRNSFFSNDRNKIYFFSTDTITSTAQIWTISLTTNEIVQKENLSDFGYSGADGYDMTFGRDGKGIVKSFPNYNNPIKDFYYRIYDFDNDSGSPFIYHNGLSEAYITGDGEYLVIMDTNIDDSLNYYHTGEVEIYNTGSAELVKTLTLPSQGIVYTFDNYPNNIYYAIDIEEPTRQIYTLKMDSILNVLDLTSLDPSSVIVNSSPFTLTVSGHGFDTISTVYFNDNSKTTSYVSDSILTAEVSTTDISAVGNYPVWVIDQWGISDTLTLSVIPHPPILTSISPAIVLRFTSGGSPPSGLTVTVTGEFFTDSSIAYFNGNAKTTTVVSDTVLTFPITGSEMATLGNYSVWISNYGSNSDTLTFSVTDTLPQSLTPTLQCVHNNGGGSYTAYFGYNNNNSVGVYVPLGNKNKFSPAPIDRVQPKLFLPGSYTNVFSVNFDGNNLTWTLDQASVTANKKSTACP